MDNVLPTLCNLLVCRMPHTKWRETKQQPHRATSCHRLSCCLPPIISCGASCAQARYVLIAGTTGKRWKTLQRTVPRAPVERTIWERRESMCASAVAGAGGTETEEAGSIYARKASHWHRRRPPPPPSILIYMPHTHVLLSYDGGGGEWEGTLHWRECGPLP